MVKLFSMNKQAFKENLKLAKNLYGSELHKYGEVLEAHEASLIANSEIDALLTDGYDTPNNHFMNIASDDTTVGFVWFRVKATEPLTSAHLCFIYIKPEFRKNHHGENTIHKLICHLKSLNISKLTLLVFIHNTAAVNLYEKLEFKVIKLLSLHGAESNTRYQMAFKI